MTRPNTTGGIRLAIRDWLRSSARLSLALFMAFCGIGVVAVAYDKVAAYLRAREAEPYQAVKTWSGGVKDYLGVEVRLKTKLVGSNMLIDVTTDGYPRWLEVPELRARNRDGAFTLTFKDADGFKVQSVRLPFKEFSTSVDKDGKPNGMGVQMEQTMSLDDYRRLASLSVEWIADTKLPDATPSAAPALRSDPCAPSLAKAERLKRLGQYGTVRQTGMGAYEAGGHVVEYLGGSEELYACR